MTTNTNTEAARMLTSIVRDRLDAINFDLLNAQNAAGAGNSDMAIGYLYGLEERLAGVIALVGATRTTLNASL